MARTPMAFKGSNAGAGAGTPSRCIIQTLNGSQYFTINGYSLTKGMGVGKYIASESFTAGGYEWCIHFYPDGKSAAGDNSKYVSVFIVLLSEGTDVRAAYELTLLDQSSKANRRINFDESGLYAHYRGKTWGNKHFCRRSSLQTFDYPEPGTFTYPGHNLYGYKRFYLRAEFETSNYLKNDTLSMICIVGVVVTSTQGPKLYSIPVPKPDLGQHFGALLDNGEDDATFGDVTFEVDGKVFQAHKLVLAARSPVFKAQFYGPMCDGDNGKIHIKNMEAPVFKAMLHFIYRDVLPDTNKVMGWKSLSSTLLTQHLLVAADRYGLDRLRLLCESKLSEDVSTETVATTLAFAEQHHAPRLKVVCLKYAAANLAATMQSYGFEYLKNNCPSLQLELLRAVAGIDEKVGSGSGNKMGKLWGGKLWGGSDPSGQPGLLVTVLSNIFRPPWHA